jgi:beta-glucosidase
MDRRTAIKIISLLGLSTAYRNPLYSLSRLPQDELSRNDFGDDFTWGVSTSAFQTEGAFDEDRKGLSIWDTFSHTEGNIKGNANADTACDFYHRYDQDIKLIRSLNFRNFRFSLSWPRIMPSGIKPVNQKGIDFYQRVIDACLENGIEPWITLYHWDLPEELERKGGWTNRAIIQWFSEYVDTCTRNYGEKVRHWMVLNEPMAFTLTGYMLGMHAPGRRGLNHFLPAIHHAALCNSQGAEIVRENVRNSHVGTTFSCSIVDSINQEEKNVKAAKGFDALLNRLFVEPAYGLGYPVSDLPFLQGMNKYILPGDLEKLTFDFDFIGIQYYTRYIVKHASLVPYFHALPVKPEKRGITDITEMGWEVYPRGLYESLKYFARYHPKEIFVTENGAAFPDILKDGKVHDPQRDKFFRDYLAQLLKAKKEGVNVKGYFVWSFMDNFEWAEGYKPRFGLVYVDFKTQERLVKDSGLWFREFLGKS